MFRWKLHKYSPQQLSTKWNGTARWWKLAMLSIRKDMESAWQKVKLNSPTCNTRAVKSCFRLALPSRLEQSCASTAGIGRAFEFVQEMVEWKAWRWQMWRKIRPIWFSLNPLSTTPQSASSDGSNKPLDMKNVGGVFVVVAGGCGLAIVKGLIHWFLNIKKIARDSNVKLHKVWNFSK